MPVGEYSFGSSESNLQVLLFRFSREIISKKKEGKIYFLQCPCFKIVTIFRFTRNCCETETNFYCAVQRTLLLKSFRER